MQVIRYVYHMNITFNRLQFFSQYFIWYSPSLSPSSLFLCFGRHNALHDANEMQAIQIWSSVSSLSLCLAILFLHNFFVSRVRERVCVYERVRIQHFHIPKRFKWPLLWFKRCCGRIERRRHALPLVYFIRSRFLFFASFCSFAGWMLLLLSVCCFRASLFVNCVRSKQCTLNGFTNHFPFRIRCRYLSTNSVRRQYNRKTTAWFMCVSWRSWHKRHSTLNGFAFVDAISACNFHCVAVRAVELILFLRNCDTFRIALWHRMTANFQIRIDEYGPVIVNCKRRWTQMVNGLWSMVNRQCSRSHHTTILTTRIIIFTFNSLSFRSTGTRFSLFVSKRNRIRSGGSDVCRLGWCRLRTGYTLLRQR